MERRVRKSGTKLPRTPKPDLLLYHWSPSTNREGINKRGLDVGKKTLQGDWRPPYVCLADDPYLAWILSGRMFPDIESWDLWMVNDDAQTSYDHYELILDTFPNTGRHYIKEYRIYTRIYKRDVLYIATKEIK